MTFTPVTLLGTYVTPTGVSASGSITFTLTQPLQDTGGNVIATRDTVTSTIVSGSMSAVLYATNDTDTIPTGVTYKVVEKLNGSPSDRTYEITLQSSPTTQYLADLVPATSTPAWQTLLDPAGKTDAYVLTVDSSSALGYKWASVAAVTATDHGTLTGLLDNDHPQYATRSNDLSDLSSTGNARTNLGLGSFALISTLAHSATTGLLDNDHPQYAARSNDLSDLSSTGNARTNLGLGSLATESTLAHSATTGLLANDHPQYATRSNDLSDLSSTGNARTNLGLGSFALISTLAHSANTGLLADDHPQYATRSNDLSDLSSTGAARTNLGLGSLATLSTITSGQITSFQPSVYAAAQTTNSSADATYELVAADLGKLVELTSGGAQTLLVPPNTAVAFPIGSRIDFLQAGAGQVTVSGSTGVTVNATPGRKTRAQWSAATILKRDTDSWVALGDLSA
jgi:hypothetical protein